MKNDFQPVVGHRFNFRAEPMRQWNGGTDCEVLVVKPYERLSYSWSASGEEAAGTEDCRHSDADAGEGRHARRMEQSGFRPKDERFYQGAGYGWQKMIAGLERVTAGLD
jgi:uncharacterized protein YndB with AHSA1/START domain